MRSRLLLVVLAATVALAVPAGAQGAVTGVVQGTTLRITGDDAAESIILTADPTTVSLDANADGVPEASFNRTAFTTVEVAMAGGADSVAAALVPGDQPLTIDGGPGPDLITAGQGADIVDGGDGPDLLSGSRGADTVRGGAGDDALTWGPGEGSDTNVGGDGEDRFTLNGSNAAEIVTLAPLSPGTVRLARNVGAVVQDLTGFEHLTVPLRGGVDSFIGSSGVAPDLPEAQIDGGTGTDTVTGGDERDLISGGADNDVLAGGAGDDAFAWTPLDTSTDTLDGGPDTDAIDVAGGNGPETFTASSPVVTAITVTESLSGAGVTGVNLERARIDAQGGDDTLAVSGPGLIAEFLGGPGIDQLTGGPGDDVLRGGPDADRLFGLGGADTLAGDEGEDLLLGGAGPDRFSCGGLGDTLDATGEDTVGADCLPPAPPPAPPAAAPTTPTAAPDTTAPGVTVSGLPTTITRAALLKRGLRFNVRTDESAVVAANLLANARSARIAAANLTIATRTLGSATGTRQVLLRPKATLIGKARRFTLTVRVVATDRAGNDRAVTRTVKVR